jgi:hypothetical protein
MTEHYMQLYSRIYDYIHEYQDLLYNYYSKHVVAFLATYYNYNMNETIWDNENLMGGAYEKIGELSGIKRNKILLLPVYFTEDMSVSFNAEDIGYTKHSETVLVIPSTYNLKPYPGDLIKFEAEYLNPKNDTYPVYEVTGVEIHPNTERRFWRLRTQVFQSRTTDEVDAQVENIYSFVEYDKQIHTLDDAQFISKLLIKHEELKKCLNKMFDNKCGFYFPLRNVFPC